MTIACCLGYAILCFVLSFATNTAISIMKCAKSYVGATYVETNIENGKIIYAWNSSPVLNMISDIAVNFLIALWSSFITFVIMCIVL